MEDSRRQGEARVKLEFLRERRFTTPSFQPQPFSSFPVVHRESHDCTVGAKKDILHDSPVNESVSSSGAENHKMQDLDQPPRKKSRLRGTNKKRPRDDKQPRNDLLCPSVVQGDPSQCFYGSDCKFSHDIKAYLAKKPPDLGLSCPNFDRLGLCSYGVTCRFASAHLREDDHNVVNEQLWKSLPQPQSFNQLTSDLKAQLRKRQLSFPLADKYLKVLNDLKKSGKSVREMVLKSNNVSCSDKDSLGEGSSRDEGLQLGCVTDEDQIRVRPVEKKKLDIQGKVFLAPLTTVGNLPFRRVCKSLGAEVTCGEMAMCTNLLQGQPSEWALLRRHHTENIFGVQICGSFPDTMSKCAELLNKHTNIDFVDINVGCPIDLVFNKGAGCALMQRATRFEEIIRGLKSVLDVPLSVKMRTGVYDKQWNAHRLVPMLRDWGVDFVTIHGRSREQRYTQQANWEYICECAKAAEPMPVIGNGDILSYEDYNIKLKQSSVAGTMIARGALIKPWIFTEVNEQRHWDISATERLDILKTYTNYGLEHWGSDQQGINKTRRFLLEWLSFLYRYIPVGVLERVPQCINERPPPYVGRSDLETLLSSSNCSDWIKISEMLLGPVPSDFSFLPKHKANSYK